MTTTPWVDYQTSPAQYKHWQLQFDGAVATFECFNRSRYDEGDHVIFVGEVERCSHREGASPLLYHGGKFYTEHPL